MNRKQFGFTPGVASLLMVLITLAMVVFSTLYLVQTNTNLKLTMRNLDNVEKYYAADAKGMAEYYTICEELCHINDYERALSYLETRGVSLDSGIITYEVEIDKNQYLLIELELKESDEGMRADIVKWQKNIRNEADYNNHDFDF